VRWRYHGQVSKKKLNTKAIDLSGQQIPSANDLATCKIENLHDWRNWMCRAFSALLASWLEGVSGTSLFTLEGVSWFC
jgi:hypothetical protein